MFLQKIVSRRLFQKPRSTQDHTYSKKIILKILRLNMFLYLFGISSSLKLLTNLVFHL